MVPILPADSLFLLT